MAKLLPTWGEIADPHSTLTLDDLLRLPDDGCKDDGYKYGLYDGMLMREMTSPRHVDVCQRLGVELGIYARSTGYPNRILQNALFDLTLPGAAKRVTLAPDLSILRGARLRRGTFPMMRRCWRWRWPASRRRWPSSR